MISCCQKIPSKWSIAIFHRRWLSIDWAPKLSDLIFKDPAFNFVDYNYELWHSYVRVLFIWCMWSFHRGHLLNYLSRSGLYKIKFLVIPIFIVLLILCISGIVQLSNLETHSTWRDNLNKSYIGHSVHEIVQNRISRTRCKVLTGRFLPSSVRNRIYFC